MEWTATIIAVVVMGLVLIFGDCAPHPIGSERSDAIIRCNYGLYGCMDQVEGETLDIRKSIYAACIDMHKHCVSTIPAEKPQE